MTCVGLLVLAVVVGCSVAQTVPGQPAAAPTLPPAIGYDDQTAPVAEEFARVRTLDMCAVHDVAAAERITRATAVSLRYTTGLASCELELGTDNPPSRWSIELGHGFRLLSTDWTSLDLGATTVRKAPERGAGCDYLVPAPGGNAGLTVRAVYSQAARSGSRPDYAAVCRTVERYLADVVVPAWENPPTLAEGRTAPRVPLLGKDPCAALAAGVTEVADDRERGKTFSMPNPYSCQGASGSAISGYVVEFEILSELYLQGQPVRLGQFTAYPSGGIGTGGCSFQIAVQPDLVFSATEGTTYHAGIVIGLPSCDDTAVAEKVLENLVQQPDAPKAKPDAQRIGDLR